jgi:hypothetical protein
MDLEQIEALEQITEMKRRGLLNDEEIEEAKREILGRPPAASSKVSVTEDPSNHFGAAASKRALLIIGAIGIVVVLVALVLRDTDDKVSAPAGTEKGSEPQQNLETPQDIEARLAAGGDISELAAEIAEDFYLFDKRLAALEKQVASGALKGQGSSGASVNAITMDDLHECIYDLLPLIKEAFNNLEVEHKSGYSDIANTGHKVDFGYSLRLSHFRVPADCK